MKIVFVGPPGSGKGTQCGLLSSQLGIPHISTGEMLRSLDSETGEAIHLRIDRGHFAPDDFILEMVSNRLSQPDCQNGYLLDGFPRTLVQARAFDEAMNSVSPALAHVIHLEVNVGELVRRLAKRSRISNRRDDSSECIHERFRIYERQTAPLLDYYGERGLVRAVDAMTAVQTVFEKICEAVSVC